jgi:hypothetical protein
LLKNAIYLKESKFIKEKIRKEKKNINKDGWHVVHFNILKNNQIS